MEWVVFGAVGRELVQTMDRSHTLSFVFLDSRDFVCFRDLGFFAVGFLAVVAAFAVFPRVCIVDGALQRRWLLGEREDGWSFAKLVVGYFLLNL